MESLVILYFYSQAGLTSHTHWIVQCEYHKEYHKCFTGGCGELRVWVRGECHPRVRPHTVSVSESALLQGWGPLNKKGRHYIKETIKNEQRQTFTLMQEDRTIPLAQESNNITNHHVGLCVCWWMIVFRDKWLPNIRVFTGKLPADFRMRIACRLSIHTHTHKLTHTHARIFR